MSRSSSGKSVLLRHRAAWVALVVVLGLGLGLLFPPVRAFAGNVLSLFRVRKIEVVEFDPAALFGEQGMQAAMGSLEQMMDEQVTVQTTGEPQVVDESTLRSLASFPVRLPQSVDGEARYKLNPAASFSIKVDLPRIRALLTELGYDQVDLPDSLDGADVSVELSDMVSAAYGACGGGSQSADPDAADAAAKDCTVLLQMPSPIVEAPDDLDLNQLGQAYLQLLGMSPSEAARFAQQVDWTATLVVPMPRTEAIYEEVSVDGVTGVFVRPTSNRLAQSEYVLLWIKGDMVYALTGTGDLATARQIANSLQ